MTIMRKDKELYGGNLIVTLTEFYVDWSFAERHGTVHEGEYFKITIQDTGIGIEADVLKKIFDPFYTTKEKGEGSGLGLSMVYNIITEHKGMVTVYSEPGIGTTVNVFLPRKDDVSKKGGEREDDQIVPGTGTILVVDDEEVMRLTAERILEAAGYTVITAEDGPEALDIFKDRCHDLALVIIDMAMPKMYGDDLYRRLKEIYPEVKVLLASGFSQDSRSVKILSEGVNGFLQKPFTMYELTRIAGDIITGS